SLVSGNDQELRPRLTQDFRQLPLAVEMDNRRLNRTQSDQGKSQQHRLNRRGQLPGHHTVTAHALFVEPGGKRKGMMVKLAKTYTAVARGLNQESAVRCQRNPLFQQLPQGGCGQQANTSICIQSSSHQLSSTT